MELTSHRRIRDIIRCVHHDTAEGQEDIEVPPDMRDDYVCDRNSRRRSGIELSILFRAQEERHP